MLLSKPLDRESYKWKDILIRLSCCHLHLGHSKRGCKVVNQNTLAHDRVQLLAYLVTGKFSDSKVNNYPLLREYGLPGSYFVSQLVIQLVEYIP